MPVLGGKQNESCQTRANATMTILPLLKRILKQWSTHEYMMKLLLKLIGTLSFSEVSSRNIKVKLFFHGALHDSRIPGALAITQGHFV
jgi:hypothetical protein